MLKDAEIREPLFAWLEETFIKARIIEEKVIKGSRADAMMITDGAVSGVEIKSDADTYERLSGQVPDYNRFFDYNFIAVGESHIVHVEEHVPAWWGVIVIREREGGIEVELMRKPSPNPKREQDVKLRNQLSFLWRRELENILKLNRLPRYGDKSKKYIMAVLMDKVPEMRLKRQITDELFERDYTTI